MSAKRGKSAKLGLHIDGRQLTVDPRSFGTVWLLACHLSSALLGAAAQHSAVTRRSRLPERVRLNLAYPELRVPTVACLLGLSPQRAAKLLV